METEPFIRVVAEKVRRFQGFAAKPMRAKKNQYQYFSHENTGKPMTPLNEFYLVFFQVLSKTASPPLARAPAIRAGPRFSWSFRGPFGYNAAASFILRPPGFRRAAPRRAPQKRPGTGKVRGAMETKAKNLVPSPPPRAHNGASARGPASPAASRAAWPDA